LYIKVCGFYPPFFCHPGCSAELLGREKKKEGYFLKGELFLFLGVKDDL
jgi:hypothetical protein